MTPVAVALTTLSVLSWGVAAEQSDGGASLGGIAAIIAASAGMVSAVGAILIGWRSKSNGDSDLEKELLMKLLKEQLDKDDTP